MATVKSATIVKDSFERTPELLGMFGARYCPVEQIGLDLIVLDDVRKLLGHKDNQYLCKTYKSVYGDPIRLEERATGSTPGAVPLKDLINLLDNYVGGPSALQIVDTMRGWGKRVPKPEESAAWEPFSATPAPLQVTVPAVIPTSTHLSIAGFDIKQDSEGRYCLNDLHKASGGELKQRPAFFMELQQTTGLVEELLIAGIPAIKSVAGRYGGTFVCKELVYAYAMWISPKFYMHVVKTYDALVTGQIAPSRSNRDQILLENSKKMIEDLTAGFEEQLEKNEALTVKLEIAEPKAALVDTLKVYTIGEVVNELRVCWPLMTVKKLSNVLALCGYLTPITRVPAKKKWWQRWFGFGLVDVIGQDGTILNSEGEAYFVTSTGLDGIFELLESMEDWDLQRLGVVGL